MTPSRKQVQSEGGSDPWFYALGVKPGEFYRETKARVRCAMLNREWPEKQRVWACLSLHTMGFNQELAVKMSRGQIVPLTQSDIEKDTDILVKNVHRCVLDLESEGWLLRKPVDEARGLRRGEVQIHCYAIPRPAQKPKLEPEEISEADRYEGLAPELAYWLRHLKLRVPSPEKLDEARALATGLSEQVEVLRQICRPEPDQMSLPGVSVNPVKVAKLSESKSPRAVDLGAAHTGEKTAQGLRAVPSDPRARALPNKEEINEIKKSKAAAAKKVAAPPPQTSSDLVVLKAKLAEWLEVDDRAVEKLWRSCRAGTFDCTEEEVAIFCASKQPGLKTARNPVAVLLTAVPVFFAGGGSASLMRLRRECQKTHQSNQKSLRNTAELILDSGESDYTEADREWAREILAGK